MNLQVLVATMHQNDHRLLKKMNIQSDAIIGNQCDRNEVEEFDYNGYKIKYFSFNERGVGLNRNNALMRAESDICLLADDDIILKKNYRNIILESFKKNPKADIIFFNLEEEIPRRFIIREKMKIGYWNYMRFGAARMAFKRKSITKHGITFNLHFGGGAEFGSGEDTLFINSCLKHNLNIIALPITIGRIEESRPSTWFEGYNNKYFIDKGALFAAISRKWSYFLCLQFLIRKRKKFNNKRLTTLYIQMLEGIKKYNQF